MINPDATQELVQEMVEKVTEPVLGQLTRQPAQVSEDREDRDDSIARTVQQHVVQQVHYPGRVRGLELDDDLDR